MGRFHYAAVRLRVADDKSGAGPVQTTPTGWVAEPQRDDVQDSAAGKCNSAEISVLCPEATQTNNVLASLQNDCEIIINRCRCVFV